MPRCTTRVSPLCWLTIHMSPLLSLARAGVVRKKIDRTIKTRRFMAKILLVIEPGLTRIRLTGSNATWLANDYLKTEMLCTCLTRRRIEWRLEIFQRWQVSYLTSSLPLPVGRYRPCEVSLCLGPRRPAHKAIKGPLRSSAPFQSSCLSRKSRRELQRRPELGQQSRRTSADLPWGPCTSKARPSFRRPN